MTKCVVRVAEEPNGDPSGEITAGSTRNGWRCRGPDRPSSIFDERFLRLRVSTVQTTASRLDFFFWIPQVEPPFAAP